MASLISARRSSWPRILSALVLFGWVSLLPAQDNAPRSVWDGIYSSAQASRGEAGYREACQLCHGQMLEGRGQSPPLAGSDFTANWNGMTVGDLLDKIQVSMPADRPGQLSKAQNAEILAYILKFNKFPAGSADMPSDAAALKNVRFESAKPAQ
jgi:mono/diheme cytochrome c family protein